MSESKKNNFLFLKELLESKLKNLYDEAPCGFIFTDLDGNFVKVNKTFTDWTGYDEKELFGRKKLQDLLSIGSKIYYETNYAPLLRMQGRLKEITLDLKTKRGQTLPILINSLEIKDDDSKPLLVKTTIFDISERRSYEKELLNERSRAEKAAARLDFLAKVGKLLSSPIDPKDFLKKIAELGTHKFCDLCSIDLIENARPVKYFEARTFEGPLAPTLNLAHLDGPILIEDVETSEKISPDLEKLIYELEPQSMITVPFKVEGKSIGIISFYMTQLGRRFSQEDLSVAQEIALRVSSTFTTVRLQKDKEEAHKELLKSREWFSTILKGIGEGVLVIGLDQSVEYLNPKAELLTGWRTVEAYGRPIEEVFNIIDLFSGKQVINLGDQIFNTKQDTSNKNTALIKKDGSQITIEHSASPLEDAHEQLKGVVIVFKDVTDKHLKEVEKSNLLEDLKRERELKERFIATLTHDLRSPLMVAGMNMEFITGLKDIPSEVYEVSSIAMKNIDRAEVMIQDLLDISRLKAGEIIPLKIDQFDLVSWIKEIVSTLAQIHGDIFKLDLPPSCYGFWSKEGIRRVLENLCSNAVKYGNPSEFIKIGLVREKKSAKVSVSNKGKPIPMKEQATLFELYKRAGAATKGKQVGWGVGLSIVKGVVEGLGGKVEVESGEGIGTTFTVSLPIDAR